MNKFLFAASAAVAAFAMAPAAYATDFNINLKQNGNTFTAQYGNDGLSGSFNDTFTFLPGIPDAIGDVSFIQIGLNTAAITINELTLNGINLLPDLVTLPGGNTLVKIGLDLLGGSHVLTVGGVAGGNASYSGTVNFVTSPVPEPATWAMMVAGIAAVGFTMRRRSNTARVAFS